MIVKGGDHTQMQVVGHQEVRTWNGRVKVVPTVASFSTSNLKAATWAMVCNNMSARCL